MNSISFKKITDVEYKHLSGSSLIGEGLYKFKCISTFLKLPTPTIFLTDSDVGGGEGGGVVDYSTTAILGKAILGHAILGNSSYLPKLISPIIELVEESSTTAILGKAILGKAILGQHSSMDKLLAPIIELVEEESKPKLQTPIIELVTESFKEKLIAPVIRLEIVGEEEPIIKLVTPVIELVDEAPIVYEITKNLTGFQDKDNVEYIEAGNGYNKTFTVYTGYRCTSAIVTIDGVDKTGEVLGFSPDNTVVYVTIAPSELVGDVVITLVAELILPQLTTPIIYLYEETILPKLNTPTIYLYEEIPEIITYTLTKNLSYVTTDDTTEILEEGSSYYAEFRAIEHYAYASHSISIGGVLNNDLLNIADDGTLSVYIRASELIGDVVITITAEPIIYTITKNFDGINEKDDSETIMSGNGYNKTFTAYSGHVITNATLTIGGVPKPDCIGFSPDNTVVHITIASSELVGDVVITLLAKLKLSAPTIYLEEVIEYYTITKNLLNVSTEDTTTQVSADGSSDYVATFYVDEGYELTHYEALIGGVVNNNVFMFDGSTIYVEISPKALNGDVVITLTAELSLPKLGTPNIELIEYYDGSVTVSAYDGVVPEMTYTDPSTVENAYDGSVEVSGGVMLINFTIAGTSYQAEDGMTWEQWCNSDYNIDGYKVTFYNSITDDSGSLFVIYSGSQVSSSDVIVDSKIYGTIAGGAA